VITRLLSHALPEGRALGEKLKAALQPIAPSLFPDKYIHALPFPDSALEALEALAVRAATLSPPAGTRVYPARNGVTLLEYDPAAEEKLAAALLLRVSNLAGDQRAAMVAAMAPEERATLIRAAFTGIAAHDA